MTVFLYTFTEREKIYNLVELLSGARFTTSYTRIGGQTRDLPDGFLDLLKKFLSEIPGVIDETDNLLSRNRIFVDRTKDIGTITKEDAICFGLSGPNLRGCGVDHDLRKKHPYLGYEQYEFDVPIGSVGDSYDRYLVRMEEMRQSVRILHQVIDTLPGGPINVTDAKNFPPPKTTVLTKMEELIHHFIIHTEGIDAPPGEIYFGHENPEGRTRLLHQLQGRRHPAPPEDSRPLVLQSVASSRRSCPGHMMSDVVAILGSLDFVMGECDR